jgi:hypothetical protein
MTVLDLILIWANDHRILITSLVAVILWGLAYGIYFRRVLVRVLRRSEAHSWQIDMVNKTAMRGGRLDTNGGKRTV